MSFDFRGAMHRVVMPPMAPPQSGVRVERSEKLREVIITLPKPMERMGFSPENALKFAEQIIREAHALRPLVVVGGKE